MPQQRNPSDCNSDNNDMILAYSVTVYRVKKDPENRSFPDLFYAVSRTTRSPSTQIWMEEMGVSKESMIFSEMGSSRSC